MSQVAIPLFEHSVAPGVQMPWHTPVTHAWFEHAAAPPHWPSEPQVCTPLPEHFVVPGTHTPEQVPFTQPYWQAVAVPQAPVAEQVCTPLAPLVAQRVAFGAHTPWHDAAPAPVTTHAWLPQSTGLPHWPPVHV
jgi:hypothetical protein